MLHRDRAHEATSVHGLQLDEQCHLISQQRVEGHPTRGARQEGNRKAMPSTFGMAQRSRFMNPPGIKVTISAPKLDSGLPASKKVQRRTHMLKWLGQPQLPAIALEDPLVLASLGRVQRPYSTERIAQFLTASWARSVFLRLWC